MDGGAEPLADLLPNTERWVPRPAEQRTGRRRLGRDPPGDAVGLDRAVSRRRSPTDEAPPRRPRRGAVGVARRHHADGARRGRDVRAAADRHRRAPHARRARGGRPGARAPGRGGRRLGGCRRRARRSGPDRRRRSGRARPRSGADGRGDPQAAGLHVDLQPRRADGLGSRSRLRARLRARQRPDAPDGRLRRGRRRRLLPRQHEPAHARDRGGGGTDARRGLAAELRVAAAALPGLRGRRRGRRDRLRGGARLRPRRLPRAARADAGDAARAGQGLPRERRAAAGRGEHDPPAERLARGGEPAAPGPLHGGARGPLGDRGRTRRLHGRPLAARPRDRAADRRGDRPLARRARDAHARGALPRHRQDRRAGRDPDEARRRCRRRSGP